MKSLDSAKAKTGRLLNIDHLQRALISINLPQAQIEAALSLYLDSITKADPDFAEFIVLKRREDLAFYESVIRAVREGMILRSIGTFLEDYTLIEDYIKSKDISHEADPVMFGRIRADLVRM
ncbi:hypothetical protein CL689_03770 [Candidatus Saccharibacteria bacterium]|nr:hypothetical protein [Candidatus Saccharibacteria bacterium]|tara:strand:+ start:6698 stop:7063 length:366 start_codon:yes stop_codon:yes gene_type:complete